MEGINKSEVEAQGHPRWDTLPPYAIRRIMETAKIIDGAGEAEAQQEVHALNKFLAQEGLLYLRSKTMSQGDPIVSHEQVDSDGITRSLVVDPAILGREAYEGTLLGCSVISLDENDHWFTYTQSVEVNQGFLTVDSLVDYSTLQVEYPTIEKDDYDEMIAAVFAELDAVGDEEFQDAVGELRKNFENEDLPPILRIRSIGIFASVLLAHPLLIASEARMQALHTVLSYAIDDEIPYTIKGYRVEEELKKDIQSPLLVVYEKPPRYVRSVGVTYVTNFEVEDTYNDTIKIKKTDSLQPALQFEDMQTHEVVTYPFRFLASIRSAEPMSDEDYEETSYRDEDGEEIKDVPSHAKDFQTHGEQIHAYWHAQGESLNQPGV